MTPKMVTFAGRNISLQSTHDATTAMSANVDNIKFVFDSEWDGFTKYAQFSKDDVGTYMVAIDADGNASVPCEMTAKAGNYNCTVVGINGDKRMVSMPLKMYVVNSVYSEETEETTGVTESLAAQLTETVSNMEAAVSEMKASISSMNEEIDSAIEQITGLANNLATLSSKIAALTERVEALENAE